MSGLWWGCSVSINPTLCPTNWHHTNAERLHSGIWGPPLEKKRDHTNTCSDLHCHRISRNVVVASRRAKPPIRVEFKLVVAILCRLHSVSSIVSAVAPRKSRHQRLHPPRFASRQASPMSKVVVHRRQTTMASRLNREKECLQSMRAVCVDCVRRQLVSNDE